VVPPDREVRHKRAERQDAQCGKHNEILADAAVVVVVAVVMRVDSRLYPPDVLRTKPTGNVVRLVFGHGINP
jgi:hypothetical protein